MPSSHHVLSALLVTLLTFSYHTLSADAEATRKCSYKSCTSNCFVLYHLLAKLMSVVCVEHVYCCLICEAIFLLTNFQYQLGVWPTHIKNFVSEFSQEFYQWIGILSLQGHYAPTFNFDAGITT